MDGDPDLTVRAELERKFLDQMIHLLADRESGRIVEAEFQRTWLRIKDVVSGLIDWKIMDEIEADLGAPIAVRPATPRVQGMGQNNSTSAPKRRTGT